MGHHNGSEREHLHPPGAGGAGAHCPRRPQAAVLLPAGGGGPEAAGRYGGGLCLHPAGAGILHPGLL